jgi:hypothetical protein
VIQKGVKYSSGYVRMPAASQSNGLEVLPGKSSEQTFLCKAKTLEAEAEQLGPGGGQLKGHAEAEQLGPGGGQLKCQAEAEQLGPGGGQLKGHAEAEQLGSGGGQLKGHAEAVEDLQVVTGGLHQLSRQMLMTSGGGESAGLQRTPNKRCLTPTTEDLLSVTADLDKSKNAGPEAALEEPFLDNRLTEQEDERVSNERHSERKLDQKLTRRKERTEPHRREYKQVEKGKEEPGQEMGQTGRSPVPFVSNRLPDPGQYPEPRVPISGQMIGYCVPSGVCMTHNSGPSCDKPSNNRVPSHDQLRKDHVLSADSKFFEKEDDECRLADVCQSCGERDSCHIAGHVTPSTIAGPELAPEVALLPAREAKSQAPPRRFLVVRREAGGLGLPQALFSRQKGQQSVMPYNNNNNNNARNNNNSQEYKENLWVTARGAAGLGDCTVVSLKGLIKLQTDLQSKIFPRQQSDLQSNLCRNQESSPQSNLQSSLRSNLHSSQEPNVQSNIQSILESQDQVQSNPEANLDEQNQLRLPATPQSGFQLPSVRRLKLEPQPVGRPLCNTLSKPLPLSQSKPLSNSWPYGLRSGLNSIMRQERRLLPIQED